MALYVVPTADEKILRAFPIYHFLTAEQVTKLCYSGGSARYVSARLKALTEEKVLHRLARETMNHPFVYCLGVRGTRYLQSLGCDIPLLHPSEHTQHAPLFLRHLLAINDFLIAAAHLPYSTPDIAIQDIKHDLTLKRTALPVIPDGWIDVRIKEHTQVCLWLEMDMGTTDQKPFRKKVSAITAFSREAYARVFGTPSLTIVFATPVGQHRMQIMKTWIEQELTATHEEHFADLFRILCIPETDLCPQEVFLSPVSVCPFAPHSLPLIECD